MKWLVEQLKSQHNIDIERLAVTDKANLMHKEQIENAWDRGRYIGYFFPQGITEPEYENNSEEYYKEQYEKE